MKIKDILNEVRKIADKYFRSCEIKRGKKLEARYWVDIITGDLSLGTLESFSAELAGQLNVDRTKFHIWATNENEIGIGFFLPYHRVLTPSEVKHKFIIVEAEFGDYFPSPGQKFYIISNEVLPKVYEASLDDHSRIFLTKWFNNHSAVKPTNFIILSALNPFETYVLALKK